MLPPVMKLRSALRVLALGFVLGFPVVVQAADYRAKVSFKKGAPVTFRDFVLTYLGERRVSSEKFARGFLVHDFQVTSLAGKQTVSWSSGTGDIGPTAFRVGRAGFQLELSRSDRLGRLQPDELVISEMP